jgi:D-alanyl-D-alanine carboxypeptidase
MSKARIASLFVTLAVTVVLGAADRGQGGLFTYGPATGIKMGTTPAAGESLVSSASIGDESYVYVTSVLALRYGFVAYDRKDLVVEGRRYATIDVPYRREETVDLVARGSVDELVNVDLDVEREVVLVKDLPDSARAGTGLGEVVIKIDGKKVGGPGSSRRRVTKRPRSGNGCGIPLRGF